MWHPAYEIAVLEAGLSLADAALFADWYVQVRWMDSVRGALAEWRTGRVECTAQFATVAELAEHIRSHGCGSTEPWPSERAWEHMEREASR